MNEKFIRINSIGNFSLSPLTKDTLATEQMFFETKDLFIEYVEFVTSGELNNSFRPNSSESKTLKPMINETACNQFGRIALGNFTLSIEFSHSIIDVSSGFQVRKFTNQTTKVHLSNSKWFPESFKPLLRQA